MFAGQAPPFGWYWRASRSRASAPSSTAIFVTSPVAPAWFVESSPRSSASRKQRPPAASTTAPAAISTSPPSPPARNPTCPRCDPAPPAARRPARGDPAVLTCAQRDERMVREGLASGGAVPLAQGRRDRVARAVAHLEQPLATCTAAAGEPVAAVLAGELD